MSKANNLKDFLIDVADAIRAKKGSTDLINPQDFSSEIASLSSGLEIVDMTETTATIEPNKVYVWGMVESLNITLGASTDESDFFAFRFRCSKPTMTSVTVNGATWADDTELDAQGKPILDLGSWYQCEIKGGTSALYARLAHYIPFADSNVEAVLLANGVGDGIGITYKEAASLAQSVFRMSFINNTNIVSFDEFQYFTGFESFGYGPSYGSSGKTCFANCTNLQRITLPKTVKTLVDGHSTNQGGGGVFWGCTSLEKVENTSQIEHLGIRAFNLCSSLKYIDLSSAKFIGDGAFFQNTALGNVILSDNIETIEANAFYQCTALSINITGKLSKIESLNGGGAFYQTQIYGDVIMPKLNSITAAYHLYKDFQQTKIDRILDLGTLATFPSGFEAGYRGTFAHCESLTVAIIPSTLTDFERSTFYGDTSLEVVVCKASTPPTLYASTFKSTNSTFKIFVPATSVEAYKTAEVWVDFAERIKAIEDMPTEVPEVYYELKYYIEK